MESWLSRTFPHLGDRERLRVLVLAIVVGTLGGLAAVGFEFAMDEAARLVFGTPDPSLGGFSTTRGIVGPIVTGLLAGATATLLTTTGRSAGVADMIAFARGAHRAPPPPDAAASAVAAILTIGGGQSAGREGPIVQIAGSTAAWLSAQAGINEHTGRVLAGSAAAAAIAASFNSPLGGAFFALELILGTFALDAFAPVVVASVTGTLVGQLTLGDRLALQVPDFTLRTWTEILLFPLLGIACGLVAITFRSLVAFVTAQFRRLPGPLLLRPAISGLAVGLMAAGGLPDVMGNGYERLEPLIAVEEPAVGFLGLLLGAKLLATALSAASRSGGGLFAPTLFFGAVTGLLYGRAAAAVLPGVDPDAGTFAIAGMAGVAATIAHAPVTMAIMLAEMTGHYAIILPLLVTIAIASIVSQTAFRHSVYVQSLIDRGVRIDHTPEELVVHGLRVRDVMVERGYLIVAPDTTPDELARLFLEHRQDRLFVVERDGRFVGLVDLQDVKGLLREATPGDERTARTLAREVPTADPATPIADVMEAFFVTSQDAVAVVGPEGHMVGIVTERDVMGALNREILRRDVGLARVASGPASDRSTDFFELPPGYAMTSLPSADVAGRTLAELDLTNRLGVVVLAVDIWDESLGRHRRVPPSADTVLGPRDGYVVMGPANLVKTLAAS